MKTFRLTKGNTEILLENADALSCYERWPNPTVIMVDGPYGIDGFPGDPKDTKLLPAWYAPHISEWSRHALPQTTLWFWGTELGWSRVHPLLEINGWTYEQAFVWNKGISHVAGNVNSKTIRQAPVVTEICVRYSKTVLLTGENGEKLSLQKWLRSEWNRTGLPMYKTNEACGVKNAATRKYFTADELWYFPPALAMQLIAKYANDYGAPTDRPYFSIDGINPLSAAEWERMRTKWNHVHGWTNVWNIPPLHTKERLKTKDGKAVHYNQKPLEIIDYIISTSSDPGDVVWDPFAGLATTAIACLSNRRNCYTAELMEATFERACRRLNDEFQRSQIAI